MENEHFSVANLETAKTIVNLAKICAVGSYMPMANRFPDFDSIDDSDLIPFWTI